MAQQVVIDIIAETKKLTAGINDANAQLNGLDGNLNKLTGKDFTSLGKSMTAGITTPLIGVAAVGLKTAADFEVSMNSLGVNAGIGGKELEKLGNLAIKLGADTVFSAGEAADAMLELSKAGMKPATIEGGALAATLDLAATEGIALTEAATIMANSMNTFSISGEEATKVTDILAAGAVASTAGVQDLAAGLKYVGSTASTLKIPLDDTVTALAAMNNAGIDASTAGTSLNRFMLGLLPTTEKASKLMDELGISFQNADGTMKTMPEIIEILKSQLTGMSDAQQVAALKTMFGVEGMRAANVLLKLNTDGYKELNDQVNKQGVAADLANARMSGLAGAIEALKGSAETAALKIGEALSPVIQGLAKILTVAINLFTALPGPIQSVVAGLGALAAAAGPVLWVIGAIKNSTNLATAATLAKAAADKVATIAQAAFNAVMAANPIALVVLAIIALIAIIVLLVKNWDKVTEVVGVVWNKIKEFVAYIVPAIRDMVGKVGESLGGLAKKALEIANDMIGAFLSIPGKMLNVGKDIVTGLWNGMQSMVGWLKNKVVGFFGNILPDFAKKALGISSPSKVFAEFGRNIVEGLVKGMDATEGMLKTAAYGIGQTAVNGFGVPALSPVSAAAPVQITIHAGLGTDPYALGREVNNALGRYGKVSTRVNRGN